MQRANQILQAVRKLGEQRQPLTRVYRSLYCEELFIAAYGKIYRNEGAMTPGTEEDTVDGMNLAYIRDLIEALRYERYRFRPARRQPIPKEKGGTRPLGIQNFTEKLVGEVLRMLLEAYYEPRFRESSHGFRPNRGCHTALAAVKHRFIGASWFIEGDIKGCFDHIDHEVLLSILARDIHDGRLLNLIRLSLKAGALDNWTYHETHSGTPQGSVLSPLLANIYLNELDTFIEDELVPRYIRGRKRASNPEYNRYNRRYQKAVKRGNRVKAQQWDKQRRQLPSQDTHDPNYRRLSYIRYADDFLLGFIGSKAEAADVKTAVGTFLREQLKLTLSPEKTLITHARTQHAHFLGYAISTQQSDTRHMPREGTRITTRAANGKIRLGIPYGRITEEIRRYQRHGKPIHERGLMHFSDAHIILTYQMRYRGLVEYYQYAVDLHRFGRLKWVMETALTKTLAHKFKISVREVYRQYHGKRPVNGYTYKTLQVEVPTTRGSSLIYWGAVPLRVVKPGSKPLVDTIQRDMKLHYTDLTKRLRADQCELCGATSNCEVHHVRKLSDLKRRWAGRKEAPIWVQRMIRIQRKTLVVCQKCHKDIHAGRPLPNKRIATPGEPDDAKVSRPVRRGDCGKAP
jgi:group II intron reverse transcriptase/maturase